MNIGILGYGNLGRALEIATARDKEVTFRTIFTARAPECVQPWGNTPVYHEASLSDFHGQLDVLLLAHGSGSRVPKEAPMLLSCFDTVDCYDAHADLPRHLAACSAAALSSGHIGIVGAGWDPGLLSVMRVYCRAAFPSSALNTFWGKGVSQGHSEVLRRIRGVKRAIQYTVPREDARLLAYGGARLSDTERHRRVCYVVPERDTPDERARITREIQNTENYFRGYDTEVSFITEEAFLRDHTALAHRGEVIASAVSGSYLSERTTLDFRLETDSNPSLTAHLMLAYAKALLRMKALGHKGAFTPLDIPPSLLFDGALEHL